jgi:molybdopterin molybdotransferase
MISVAEALEAIFALVDPLGPETVPLRQAAGRVLAAPATAARDQPPFDAAQMDGYALRGTDVAKGVALRVIGEAAAGHAFSGTLGPGDAVRIFTGAPVPAGADRVVMQEDTDRQGDLMRLKPDADPGPFIRPRGGDFAVGDAVPAGRVLRAADIALLASMNVPWVSVVRRPVVAILSTGDELVMPGEVPRPDQIIASNTFGLAALVEDAGGIARCLPIVRDTVAAFDQALTLAQGADLIVTSGGASVGDHDVLARAATDLGLRRAFYKVAMRPGKPLTAGWMRGIPMIGLPGNPVSAMVCGSIFMQPAIRALAGHPKRPARVQAARLGAPLLRNGPRAHYMRGFADADGAVHAAEKQDSSLQKVLSEAEVLIVRPPHDPPRATGDTVKIVKI